MFQVSSCDVFVHLIYVHKLCAPSAFRASAPEVTLNEEAAVFDKDCWERRVSFKRSELLGEFVWLLVINQLNGALCALILVSLLRCCQRLAVNEERINI